MELPLDTLLAALLCEATLPALLGVRLGEGRRMRMTSHPPRARQYNCTACPLSSLVTTVTQSAWLTCLWDRGKQRQTAEVGQFTIHIY
jgi:hypothetical protein